MGETPRGDARPCFHIRSARGASDQQERTCDVSTDGAVSAGGIVQGTYIHGLFDRAGFRRAWLNRIRLRRGLPPVDIERSERFTQRFAQGARSLGRPSQQSSECESALRSPFLDRFLDQIICPRAVQRSVGWGCRSSDREPATPMATRIVTVVRSIGEAGCYHSIGRLTHLNAWMCRSRRSRSSYVIVINSSPNRLRTIQRTTASWIISGR